MRRRRFRTAPGNTPPRQALRSASCPPARRSRRARSTSSPTRPRILSCPASGWRPRATGSRSCAPAASAAQGNPLAGHVDRAYSYSISQPSRTLNDFELPRLRRRRGWPQGPRRHAQPHRRRQRRPDQLPLRPDRPHGAQSPEPSLSRRHLPVRAPGAHRPPERQNGRPRRALLRRRRSQVRPALKSSTGPRRRHLPEAV